MMGPRVDAAAAEAFERLHARRTKGATGIVIYVSLFERRVAIRADRAVSEKVPPDAWKEICSGMTRALGEGRPRDGFVEAIRKCGDLLARHFPVRPGDENELTNELRVLD
jgi:putative membrane protein